MAKTYLDEVKRRVGENIRRGREGAGLTQAELAEIIGLEPRTVQRLEAGSAVSLQSAVAVAEALRTPIEKLFESVKVSRRRRVGRPKVGV